MSLIPMFKADYPGAVVFPCDETNAYNPADHGGVVNNPRGFGLHTPEEKADGYPATPHWFAQEHPERAGSTIYFVAKEPPHVWQIMPETWAAIANGLDGKPRPSWAQPGSLNWQTLNVEIEGYAATIQDTLIIGSGQWIALVDLIRTRGGAHGIPMRRPEIFGHYEVSVQRSDPGAGFPWDALISELQGGDMFVRLNGTAAFFQNRVFSASRDNFMSLRTDFPGLPATAKAVELDVRIEPTTIGDLVLKDGDKKYADAVNRWKSQAVVKVIPAADGRIFFDVLNAPVKFLGVGIVGYWT